jgi:hypothetical protein
LGPEAVTAVAELGLEDRFEHLPKGLLDDPIPDAGDSYSTLHPLLDPLRNWEPIPQLRHRQKSRVTNCFVT